VNPGAIEVCDSDDTDEDCSGAADDADSGVDSSGFITFYADDDGDGYGDPARSVDQCDQPSGYVTDATDCDDSDPSTYPEAAEIDGDGLDQDCDGSDSATATDIESEKSGCGCSASPRPSSAPLAVGLLGLAALRRRRNAPR